MANSTLARRYALALINLSQKEDLLSTISKDFNSFCETWNVGDALLKKAMLNPGISVHERQLVLSKILEKLSLHAYVNNFLYLLLDKSRLMLLNDIHEAFDEMADELSGKVRARVTTAVTIDMKEQDKIRQTLASASNVTPEKISIQFDVDPEIIGGIIARVGDTLYDASVSSRIQDIKQSLL